MMRAKALYSEKVQEVAELQSKIKHITKVNITLYMDSKHMYVYCNMYVFYCTLFSPAGTASVGEEDSKSTHILVL